MRQVTNQVIVRCCCFRQMDFAQSGQLCARELIFGQTHGTLQAITSARVGERGASAPSDICDLRASAILFHFLRAYVFARALVVGRAICLPTPSEERHQLTCVCEAEDHRVVRVVQQVTRIELFGFWSRGHTNEDSAVRLRRQVTLCACARRAHGATHWVRRSVATCTPSESFVRARPEQLRAVKKCNHRRAQVGSGSSGCGGERRARQRRRTVESAGPKGLSCNAELDESRTEQNITERTGPSGTQQLKQRQAVS